MVLLKSRDRRERWSSRIRSPSSPGAGRESVRLSLCGLPARELTSQLSMLTLRLQQPRAERFSALAAVPS